jgi:endonuclease YncB( thermonuclease family)
MGTTPLAINYETGQSILPAGFERQVLQADFQPVALEARVIDVLDRGVLLVPTREMIRLRGARIPSQLTGTESARGAGREAMRILRNLARSGNLTIIPGAPVRDNSGAILVTVPDDQSRNLAFMLVREGLAMAEPGDFDTADAAISRAFQRAQSDARRERLGLWGRR